jgi:hypothetical protein
VKLRVIRVHFGIFDFGIVALVGPREAAGRYITRFQERAEPVVIPENCRGYCMRRDGHAPCIWLPRPPKTPREYGTLSHEILHAMVFFQEWKGEPLCIENEETYCHALGYCVTAVLDKLARR